MQRNPSRMAHDFATNTTEQGFGCHGSWIAQSLTCACGCSLSRRYQGQQGVQLVDGIIYNRSIIHFSRCTLTIPCTRLQCALGSLFSETFE